MNKFDDIFRENVEKAFGSYDAGHLADEGWNSFVARQKAAGRRHLVIPLWAKAASVAILIGASGFFAFKMLNRQTQNATITMSTSPVDNQTQDIPTVTTSETVQPVITTLPASSGKTVQTVSSFNVASEKPLEVTAMITREIPAEVIKIKLPHLAGSFISNQSDSLSLPVGDRVKEAVEEAVPSDDETVKARFNDKTSLLAGFSGLLAKSDEASSSAPGMTVGLYLDQKLTRRISLRPGVALSRQSMGVESSNGITEFNYTVPLSDGTSGTVESYTGQFDMLAIEVPVNIVFNVHQRRNSGIYVSAGTSALIYLNQNFEGNFVNEYTKEVYSTMSSAPSYETRYSTVEVQNNYGAFSRVDLFNLVSFSAGYFLPYSKTGTMIIEPFVQLPLAELTSLDMKVRYAGIALKISFGREGQGK